MRRIDVIGLGILLFGIGGLGYGLLRGFGLDPTVAGVWSQVLLVGGVVGWLLTYLFRVFAQQMTYQQQRREYEEIALQKRLDSLTPEELAQLQAEIEAEQRP